MPHPRKLQGLVIGPHLTASSSPPFSLILHPLLFKSCLFLFFFVKAHQAKYFKRSQLDSGVLRRRLLSCVTLKPVVLVTFTCNTRCSNPQHPSAHTECLVKTVLQLQCELHCKVRGHVQRRRSGLSSAFSFVQFRNVVPAVSVELLLLLLKVSLEETSLPQAPDESS